MKFDSLKKKCEHFRSTTDYLLTPNSYVMVMIDGHSFSKLIKNNFKKPFDDDFISMMNETAKHVCSKVEGIKFAYVQSDEISFVLTDFDTPTTDSYFGYRLCKLQSIIAAEATAKFNQLFYLNRLKCEDNENFTKEQIESLISEKNTFPTFDCKAWNVPYFNEVFAWFLYRQIDCIRNSKQQTAQTYLSHNTLSGLDTDKQISLLKETKGIDWNEFPDDRKYGRFIYKVIEHRPVKDRDNEVCERRVWKAFPASELTTGGKKVLMDIGVIPVIDRIEINVADNAD